MNKRFHNKNNNEITVNTTVNMKKASMRKAIKKATRNHKRKIIIENLKSKRKASNFVE